MGVAPAIRTVLSACQNIPCPGGTDCNLLPANGGAGGGHRRQLYADDYSAAVSAVLEAIEASNQENTNSFL